MSAMEQLLAEALALTDEERAEMAARLIGSLEPDGGVQASAHEAAWTDEVARRSEELRLGQVEPVPLEAAETMMFPPDENPAV